MGSIKLKKVLISDKLPNECIDTLKNGGVEVTYSPGLSKVELIEMIPEYHGLVVRSATKVTADVISAAKNLEIIGRAGTGTDNIDIPCATDNGIVVMNTPGGNTMSAVEHTCCLILAMCRNLPNRHAELMNGKWNRINGIELSGKTLGVIGLGRIGSIVAERMRAFGMKTVGYDPIISPEVAAERGIQYMDLEDMWPVCDFITIHVPLLPSTKHLVNAKVFGKCKKGVRFVNCARGGIINEADLLDALVSGQVACAALDVFEQEPPQSDCDLMQHPNLIASPHLGASTVEAQTRVALEIAEQFLAFRDGNSTFGAINAPLLSAAVKNPGAVALAERLGQLIYQLSPKSTMLQVAADNSTFTPQSVMAGFLSAKGVPSCNLVTVTKLALANNINFEYSEQGEGLTVTAGDSVVKGRCEGNMSVVTSINGQDIMIPLQGQIVLIQTNKGLTSDLISALNGKLQSVYIGATFVAVKVDESVPLDKVQELNYVENVSQLVFA